MRHTAAGVVAAALVIVFAYGRSVPATGEPRVGASGASTTVLALPFTDASDTGKFAPLADGMGDLLVSFLSDAPGLVFVERVALDRVLREHELTLAGLTGSEAATRVGGLLGAAYILAGAVTVAGEQVRIDARLYEARTTRVVCAHASRGAVDDPIRAVQELARRLGGALDAELPERKSARTDPDPVANLHYMRGLGYYYAGMRDDAIVELMRALNAKPGHARARYWCGVCYLDDREYAHAQIEFRRFLDAFPEHPLAPQARQFLATCLQQTRRE